MITIILFISLVATMTLCFCMALIICEKVSGTEWGDLDTEAIAGMALSILWLIAYFTTK